jgi:hypothetical protein
VKDLYDKIFKSLKKEFEDLRRWKDLLCSWTGRINIVKMGILLQAIYRFSAILINIQKKILHRDRKSNLQIHLEYKKEKNRILKTILNKERTGGITITDLKLYYRAIVIKNA